MSLPMNELIKKLPSCWWGLFAAIRSLQPQAVEVWFQNQAMSRYGCLPDWDGLLLGLIQEEPCCQDQSLLFLSRFVQLSPDIQCHLLSFLLRHRDEVPLPSLKEFVASTVDELLPEFWSGILMRSLCAYVQICSCNAPESLVKNHYSFTSTNTNHAKQVCENLKSGDPNIWTHHIIDKGDDSERISHVSYIQNDTDATPLDDGTDQLDTQNLASQEIIILDDDEPEIKRPKKNSDCSQETRIELSVEHEDIDPEILAKVEKLKELWLGGLNASSDIEVFLALSKLQILNICQTLQLDKLPEAALLVACENLSHVSGVISNINCGQFLSSTIYCKVMELSQSASRHLSGVVSLCAQSFTKPLIDAVLTRCFQECLGVPQAELICKLIREILPTSASASFLQEIVRSQMKCLDDNVISVFQALIDTKVNLSEVLLTDFLRSLSGHSQDNRNNLKYGKLLAGILNKYSQQITTEQKEILTTEIQNHGTFLKKSLMAALKKISN